MLCQRNLFPVLLPLHSRFCVTPRVEFSSIKVHCTLFLTYLTTLISILNTNYPYNMKQAIIFLSLAYLVLCSKHRAYVHSFQLQYFPKPYRNSLSQISAGFFNFGDWSDVKPNCVEHDSCVVPSESTLSPIQSAYTKYGMIAYVAHMCAFLPQSLLPTYLQTKLGRFAACCQFTSSERAAISVVLTLYPLV